MNRLRQWMRQYPTPAVLTLLIAVCLFADLWLARRTSGARQDLRAAESRYAAMTALAERCSELQTQALAADVRMRSADALNVQAVEDVLDRRNLRSQTTQVEARPERCDDVIEHVLTVKLQGVYRKELVEFLMDVEALDPGIRTSALKMTAHRMNPEAVDAEIRFSGYEPKAQTI